jgi:hypothetical protein
MQVELCCPRCPCRLAAPSGLSAEAVVRQMIDEGPWCALAEGATFGDMVRAALRRRGAIRCPECRAPLAVRQAGPGAPFAHHLAGCAAERG